MIERPLPRTRWGAILMVDETVRCSNRDCRDLFNARKGIFSAKRRGLRMIQDYRIFKK